MSTTDTIRNGVNTGQLLGTLVAIKARLTTSRVYAAGAGDTHEETLRELLARERKKLGLTAREAEVLPLVARRFTNREIAAALVISVRTAEHHVAHILRKLGAANRLEAGAIAHRLVSETRERRAVRRQTGAFRPAFQT
jgi:DNA-binding NarL/FixJ family response regulator